MIAAMTNDGPSCKAGHLHLTDMVAEGQAAEKMRILEFVVDGTYFAVDLDEVRTILISANLGHTGESPSIIPGIIRRNRKNTVVLDLEYCIYLQWGLGTGRGKTRLLMLDDRSGIGPMGILLPGFSSIRTIRQPRVARSHSRIIGTPVRGIFRKTCHAPQGCTEKRVVWIDPCHLVENCMTGMHHTAPARNTGGIA